VHTGNIITDVESPLVNMSASETGQRLAVSQGNKYAGPSSKKRSVKRPKTYQGKSLSIAALGSSMDTQLPVLVHADSTLPNGRSAKKVTSGLSLIVLQLSLSLTVLIRIR
jgi:hypothetical protein